MRVLVTALVLLMQASAIIDAICTRLHDSSTTPILSIDSVLDVQRSASTCQDLSLGQVLNSVNLMTRFP